MSFYFTNLSNKRGYKLFAYLIFTVTLFLILKTFYDKKPDLSVFYLNHNKSSSVVQTFDLNKELEPISVYNEIKCRKSKQILQVDVTLCVYDIQKDIFMSQHIWRDGIWEENIIRKFLNYVYFNPDHLVIDLGANTGQYGLFAAKLGRMTVMIEPFYDNILRIHKAARVENIQNKIVLLMNAVSNKRGEIRELAKVDENPGGQGLTANIVKENEKISKNKYFVRTILFDDILNYLPINPNTNGKYKRAIMKIDIEGFEPYAFQSASILFKQLKIDYIFMEWGMKGNTTDLNYNSMVRSMTNFLFDDNLSPYDLNGIKLDKNSMSSWPFDIVWVRSKENFKF